MFCYILRCHQTKAWGVSWRHSPPGSLKARAVSLLRSTFPAHVLAGAVTTSASLPDPEGPVSVQAPERGRADTKSRRVHLRGPYSAGGSQRGLGDRDLSEDRLPGLPAGELHGASQRVWHLGEAQVSVASSGSPTVSELVPDSIPLKTVGTVLACFPTIPLLVKIAFSVPATFSLQGYGKCPGWFVVFCW